MHRVVVLVSMIVGLAFAGSAAGGLWINLERPVLQAGTTVTGEAVSPCGSCGPALSPNGQRWTLTPASPPFRLAPPRSSTDRPVRFAAFRIWVPQRWNWRFLPGRNGAAIWVSNARLRAPRETDPIKTMPAGRFVLTLLPLGGYGSSASPLITRSDVLARDDPARPRGRAAAHHSYCAPQGPCLSIDLLYRGKDIPAALLAAVNQTLGTLQAVRAP